jgi:hypothetical protein
MTPGFRIDKIVIALILALLWICVFLFVKPTLVIDFGAGIPYISLQLSLIVLGLLVLFFFHLLYPSNTETTKLSWTAVFTISWLALMFFYPFNGLNVSQGEGPQGAVAFFALVGGLGVCLLWIRFFSDEIRV